MSVPDLGKSCPGSSRGCYFTHASFPVARIYHFFQENAAMQTDGFGCFRSAGPKLRAAPRIPALGKVALSVDSPRTLQTPPAKRAWARSAHPGHAPVLRGAGGCLQEPNPGVGVWLQLEDQSVQMEQLRQELDAQREELDQAQHSLSHAKQVCG